jgi:uncharacterized protein (TIGR02611 family)
MAQTTPPIDPGAQPGRLHTPRQWLRVIVRSTKRLAILVAGATVMGAGIAMLVLPGPGVLVIIVGLAILASEFAWAERALDRAAGAGASAISKVNESRASKLALMASGFGLMLGGGIVLVFSEDWRVAGVSAIVAGVIGLATTHSAVHRWLDGRNGRNGVNGVDGVDGGH